MTKRERSEFQRLKEVEARYLRERLSRGWDEEQMKYIRKMPVEIVKNKLR